MLSGVLPSLLSNCRTHSLEPSVPSFHIPPGTLPLALSGQKGANLLILLALLVNFHTVDHLDNQLIYIEYLPLAGYNGHPKPDHFL